MWILFITITVLDVWLVFPKRPTFSHIHEEGLDNGDFYFSKIFQNFQTFFYKRAIGWYFDHYGVVFR